jgi:hypothetical protein
MDDYKTGTLGKTEEQVRHKFTHQHRYSFHDVKGGSHSGKCIVCGKEKVWKNGSERPPTT